MCTLLHFFVLFFSFTFFLPLPLPSHFNILYNSRYRVSTRNMNSLLLTFDNEETRNDCYSVNQINIKQAILRIISISRIKILPLLKTTINIETY